MFGEMPHLEFVRPGVAARRDHREQSECGVNPGVSNGCMRITRCEHARGTPHGLQPPTLSKRGYSTAVRGFCWSRTIAITCSRKGWLISNPKMHLLPDRVTRFTLAEPAKRIRSARSETVVRTEIGSFASMRIPLSDTSRHSAIANLGWPVESSQEI